MRKKLQRSDGLTMVEMLCAVAILILLGLLLNTGLQMAVKSYHDLTAEAETQLLASTLMDALADELRYARNVTTEKKTIDGVETDALSTYDSGYKEAEGTLEGTSTIQITDGKLQINGNRVLPDLAYGKDAYLVEQLEITCANDCFTIRLKVKEAAGDISTEAELTVRCLNGIKIPTGTEGEGTI